MKIILHLPTFALLVSFCTAGLAADTYQQPRMHGSHMPIAGPYQVPMHPMMQQYQPRQHIEEPATNTLSQGSQPPAMPAGAAQTGTAKPYHCHHKMRHATGMQQIKAMREQQGQMQQHLQRMETRLANIEELIRQMVENRQ